jgi:hypothetical protein
VNWSAASATVGITLDSTSKNRRIFYIDSKGLLQYYSCDLAAAANCTLQDRQDDTYWAVADDPNAAMGSAYVNRTGDLFYFSGSKLVMVQIVSGAWAKLRTLTGVVSDWSTTSSSTASSTSTASSGSASTGASSTGAASSGSASDSASSSSGGLSAGAAAGVAVAVVIIVLAAAAGAFFLWRRRRAAKNNQAGGEKYVHVPPTAGESGKYEMETTPAKSIMEVDATPMHSPAPPQYANAIPHEFSGNSVVTTEMEAKPVVRYELS